MNKRRFNAADAVMIVVAIISVLCIIMRINHIGSGKYLKDEDYKINFIAYGVSEEDTQKLTVGDRLRTEDNTLFGTLTEGYRTEPSADGGYDVTAAAVCTGTTAETGLLSRGKIIRPGDKMTVSCKDVKLEITVISFEKAE